MSSSDQVGRKENGEPSLGYCILRMVESCRYSTYIMLTFKQFLSEGINIKGIKVPKPETEDDGYKVYTYPGPTDILQVGIGPKEDGAHHIWFSHGGSFSRSSKGTQHTPEQTMHVLNRVAATVQHHSKRHRANEYTYETADSTRHGIYQRVAKAAGINAKNLMRDDHMFSRHYNS